MKKKRNGKHLMLLLAAGLVFTGCATQKKTESMQYTLTDVREVKGRQGVCTDGESVWVSGSKGLFRYDAAWNLVAENTDPFQGYEKEVNHIGDIDVYGNELYIGAEYFLDGEGKNIQIAVYDANTLQYLRSFPFAEDSGQLECSGIAVNPDDQTVWMCSWVGNESGKYLYGYDLKTGEYLRKVQLDPEILWLQGIAYFDGDYYLTADDGDADKEEPDHMYRVTIRDKEDTAEAVLEKSFDDVIRQGEIEGLSFDGKNQRFLLLYNRGARIIAGMPSGYYEGYDREISEVFVYEISGKER